MATRLSKTSLRKSNRSRYDWDSWLDGGVWVGERGEDYTCQTQSFVTQLYKAAYDRGLKIHVTPKEGGRVEWQAYSEPAEEDKVA